jgi:hypothetical protein
MPRTREQRFADLPTLTADGRQQGGEQVRVRRERVAHIHQRQRGGAEPETPASDAMETCRAVYIGTPAEVLSVPRRSAA